MLIRDKLLYEIDILNQINQKSYVYNREMVALLEEYTWNAEMLYIIARKLNNVDIEYLQHLIINTNSAKYMYLFALEGFKGINYNLITEAICNTGSVEYMFKMAHYVKEANYRKIIATLVKMKRFDVVKLLEIRYPLTKKSRIINKMVKKYAHNVKNSNLQPEFNTEMYNCILDKIL